MNKLQAEGFVSKPSEIRDRHIAIGRNLTIAAFTSLAWPAGVTFANAEDFKVGEVNMTVHGGVTTGPVFRADNTSVS